MKKHKRDKHSIKADQAIHMDELENGRVDYKAKERFRKKPYQTKTVSQYINEKHGEVEP